MNKKQLSEYPQIIAKEIADGHGITVEEAQTLVGLALKKLRDKIVELAAPRVTEPEVETKS